MSEAVALNDYTRLLAAITERVVHESPWTEAIEQSASGHEGVRAHLAVMHEPYLRYILEGRKTIESRFSRRQIAPYEQVRAGDLMLFKQLSGPVTGIALIAAADFYVLDPKTWRLLRRRFASALAADSDEFWQERQGARYATLMRLGAVRAVAPVDVDKRDRRGWVVLERDAVAGHPNQLALLDDDLTRRPAPRWIARTSPAASVSTAQLELEVD